MPGVRELRADENEVARHVRGEETEQRNEAERIDIARCQGQPRVLARDVIERVRREPRICAYWSLLHDEVGLPLATGGAF